MRHLGTLDGNGRLEVKGVAVGNIDYSIDVWIDDGSRFKTASGSANGDYRALDQLFNAGAGKLHLANGGTVNVAVTHLDQSGAEIAISGPVPGF